MPEGLPTPEQFKNPTESNQEEVRQIMIILPKSFGEIAKALREMKSDGRGYIIALATLALLKNTGPRPEKVVLSVEENPQIEEVAPALLAVPENLKQYTSQERARIGEIQETFFTRQQVANPDATPIKIAVHSAESLNRQSAKIETEDKDSISPHEDHNFILASSQIVTSYGQNEEYNWSYALSKQIMYKVEKEHPFSERINIEASGQTISDAVAEGLAYAIADSNKAHFSNSEDNFGDAHFSTAYHQVAGYVQHYQVISSEQREDGTFSIELEIDLGKNDDPNSRNNPSSQPDETLSNPQPYQWEESDKKKI